MYFRIYGLRKTWFDKCLKSALWEDPAIGNIVNGRNTDSVSRTAPLPYSSNNGKVIELEKVTLSDMQSLKTFC